jgi:hypothetical protein
MALKTFYRAASGLVFLVAALGADPVSAQNYDGPGILKFGVFGQAGIGAYGVTANIPAIVGPPASPAVNDSGSAHRAGLGAGLTFGYDYSPMRTWLVGLEVDAAVGDWGSKRIGTTEADIDHLVNFRVRGGQYMARDTLIYGVTGLAVAGVEWRNISTGTAIKRPETLLGWNIGVGVEWPWHHWLLFAEYSSSIFGGATVVASTGAGGAGGQPVNGSIDLSTHMIRFGIKLNTGTEHYIDSHVDHVGGGPYGRGAPKK